MEYSLLKTISTPLPYLKSYTPYVRLTSTPNIDLVNPGVSQSVRLFSFYVPLGSNHNPYEISKIDTKKLNNQEGFGELDDTESNENASESESSLELSENNKLESLPDINAPAIDIQKEPEPGLKESLNYPKISIKKTIFKPKSTVIKKNLKHKFTVI